MYKRSNVGRFVRYFRRTLKQKLCALAMIALGVLTAWVGEDATALVFILFIAVPMLISGKRWMA